MVNIHTQSSEGSSNMCNTNVYLKFTDDHRLADELQAL